MADPCRKHPANQPGTRAEPTRQPDLWPTSLAPPLAPGGRSACHAVPASPALQGQGSTARPGNRKGRTMTEAAVSVAGNRTDQPELRHAEGGIARARFRVAVSDRREQEASFFTVVVRRDQAEHVAGSLSKGSRVVVVGRLRSVGGRGRGRGAGVEPAVGDGDHDQDDEESGPLANSTSAAGERDAVNRAVARDKPGDVGGHPRENGRRGGSRGHRRP
jgi:Single-strand binding protein family